MLNRRHILAAATLAALPRIVRADPQMDRALALLVDGGPDDFDAVIDHIGATGDITLAPAVILASRFSRGPADAFDGLLTRLTGAREQGWFDWMLWQQAHPEVVPHAGYADLMRALYLRIDPAFDGFLKPRYLTRDAARIRIEEITWGGVKKDGIPSLDNPKLTGAGAASYLRDDDLVFGVQINGDARAYPLRIMGWHEMFNDRIGGVNVALAYCTLCGAGILFESQIEGRSRPMTFGSSGFLYRSNKLMFDRGTNSLWNQFTGEPVVGPLADSGIKLRERPVVIEPWADWRGRHPKTKVLSLDTGYQRDYGSGVVYSAYFSSPDLMFPATGGGQGLAQKDFIFGIRSFAAAKAWPLDAFKGGMVINDSVGQLNVVLIGDGTGRTVRAYDRGAHQFRGDLSVDGTKWTLTEDALVAPNGETAPRVAGHVAYWFAWDGYLGTRSDLYSG